MSFTVNWTAEEDGILCDLWQRGLSAAEIGRHLGRSKNSVIGRSHRQGLASRPSPIRPAAKKPERITGNTLPPLPSLEVPQPSLATRMLVAKLLTEGRSNEAVSEETKLSVHAVGKIRKAMNFPKRRVSDHNPDLRKDTNNPKVFDDSGMEFQKSYIHVNRWKNGNRFQFGKLLKRHKPNGELPTSEDIDAFIAQHGVTMLPAAAAAVTTASISDQDRIAISTYQSARNEEHAVKYAPRNKLVGDAVRRAAAMRR